MNRPAYGPKERIFYDRIVAALGVATQISNYTEVLVTPEGCHFPGWDISFNWEGTLNMNQLRAMAKMVRSNSLTIGDTEETKTLDELENLVRWAVEQHIDHSPHEPVQESDESGILNVCIYNARRMK